MGVIAKNLDNFQICAPRADAQRSIAWGVSDPEIKEWRFSVARELEERRTNFRTLMMKPVDWRGVEGVDQEALDTLIGQDETSKRNTLKSPDDLGWKIESCGAYYAYVRQPFKIDPEVVARGLSGLVGVVALPGEF